MTAYEQSFTDTIESDDGSQAVVTVNFSVSTPEGIVLQQGILEDAAEKALELIADEGLLWDD